jgi:P-type conjugative transfer protein TrbJ
MKLFNGLSRANRICRAVALLTLPLAALIVPAAASAQFTVFDPTNYTQNALSAARSLEQIDNQVRALQNQATALANMATNLGRVDFPELTQLRSTLDRIGQLMKSAQGVDFNAASLDRELDQLFPRGAAAQPPDKAVAAAQQRLTAALDAHRKAMAVQSRIVSDLGDDAGTLSALAARSQGATGNLAVSQVTNQLLALVARQQLSLQAMMAAEGRSAAIEQTRRDQAEAEARAATTRFLGSGSAYSPR